MPTGVVGTPHVRPLQLQCHPRLRPRLQQDHGRVSLQGGTCQPFSLPLPTPAILLSLLYCPLPPHCHPVTSLSPPIMPLDNPPVTSLSPRACCHPNPVPVVTLCPPRTTTTACQEGTHAIPVSVTPLGHCRAAAIPTLDSVPAKLGSSAATVTAVITPLLR